MSARITAGMLCYIRDGKSWYTGKTCTTVRYVGYFTLEPVVCPAWEVLASWDGERYYVTDSSLVPITGDQIDTTETTDALHDSLVAVLAEARP